MDNQIQEEDTYEFVNEELASTEIQKILPKTIENSERLFDGELQKKYFLPKQVMYDDTRSILVKHLSISSDVGVTGKYDFSLEDIIIEYMPHLIGKQETFFFAKTLYQYAYLDTYISLGIPTERYNWFLKEAERLTGKFLKRNSLFESDDYTWVIAELDQTRSVECCVYSSDSDSLIRAGYLRDQMLNLKSNVIGVGHFNVSVYRSRDLSIFYLKFTLSKFQFVNKTEKPTLSVPFSTAEPPTDMMKKLLIDSDQK